MSKKIFFKNRKKVSPDNQLYLILFILLFFVSFMVSQCGIYEINEDNITHTRATNRQLYQKEARSLVSKLNFSRNDGTQEGKQKKYASLKQAINQRKSQNYPNLSVTFTDVKESDCLHIGFTNQKKNHKSILFAFPWGGMENKHFLYTALSFAETVSKNSYQKSISILIYDGSKKCSDVEESMEIMGDNLKPSKAVLFYPSRSESHMWLPSSGGTSFSSLYWRKIIPIEYQHTFWKSLGVAAFPFFDHPGSGLFKDDIPTLAIGYKAESDFSTILLKRAIISLDNILNQNESLENRGLWLSSLSAMGSGTIILFILIAILFIIVPLLILYDQHNEKMNILNGVISVIYFSIPVITFFILLKIFSLNETPSMNMLLISIAAGIITYFVMKKMSQSFFDVQENTISVLSVFVFILILLAFHRPFLFFLLMPVAIIAPKIRQVKTIIAFSFVFMALLPLFWFMFQPYGLTEMIDYFFDPALLNRSLASGFFTTIFNSLLIGSIISLITKN